MREKKKIKSFTRRIMISDKRYDKIILKESERRSDGIDLEPRNGNGNSTRNCDENTDGSCCITGRYAITRQLSHLCMAKADVDGRRNEPGRRTKSIWMKSFTASADKMPCL